MVEQAPRALLWYKVYCFLCGGWYLLSALHLLGYVLNAEATARDLGIRATQATSDETWTYFFTPDVIRLSAGLTMGLMLLFAVVNFGLPWIKRNGVNYWIHFANIVLGVGSCCFAILCLPLLVAWVRPDVKAWFGA